jgi:hypothetical protein
MGFRSLGFETIPNSWRVSGIVNARRRNVARR